MLHEEDAVRQLVAQDPDVLDQRDAVGASPIHVAFLLGLADVGKELVQAYPTHATYVYVEGPYTGENILHIAIIQQVFVRRFPYYVLTASVHCTLLEIGPTKAWH